MDFIAFVTSPEGQEVIAGYTREGVVLFNPAAVPIMDNP
jgi:ABC-type tungstate transport system permease subunit